VNFTLWRNGVLLGRVRIPFSVSNSASAFCGMLEVEPAFADIEPLMQHTSPFMAGKPVLQSLMKDAHRGPGPVALKELTPEQARGLPADRILEVRDDTGTRIPIQFLSIDRLWDTAPTEGELFDVCRERGIAPSPWTLFVKPDD
jgi:hypothetical protein